MSTDTITINSQQASLMHLAISAAIRETTDQLKLKSSQPFAVALALQISAYKAEQEKLEAAFPRLAVK
jgi:hypothetical protein